MDEKLIINAEWITKKSKEASDARQYVETEWFLNDLFSDGIHSVYYDIYSNEWQAKEGGLRTIDMYNVILNGLVNSTVKNDPRPEAKTAYGELRTDDVKASLKATNIFCASLYDNENFKQTIRDAVKDGYKKNEGWVRVEYHDSDNDGIGEIRLMKDSSWNVLRDPSGCIDAKTGEFNGEYLIRQMLVPIDKVKNDPTYLPGRKKVSDYSQKDPSMLKAELLSIKNNDAQVREGLCLVSEVYYRKFEIEKRDDKQFQVLKYYRHVWSEDIELTKEEELDVPAYPLYCYQATRTDGEFGNKPHMSKIIPLNKTLDVLLTKMEKQIRTMNVGRILKHKDTVMNTLTDEDGQVIEYSGARVPEVMNASGISGDLFQFYGVISKLIQDTGLFHLESAGGGGNISGIALAQKQAGDIFNVSEPTENLAMFVGAVFKHVIALASKKYVTSRNIYDEEGNSYKVIGDSSEHSPSNAVRLKDVSSVRVSIVPGGVYSDVQLKQDMMELYQLQLVGKEAVLDSYKIGNTRLQLDRLEDEALLAQGLTPATEKAIKKAEKDFKELVKGKKVKVPKITEDNAQKGYLLTLVEKIDSSKDSLDEKQMKAMSEYLTKVTKEWGIPMGSNASPEASEEGLQASEGQSGGLVPNEPSSAQEKLLNPTGVAEEEVGEIQARNDAIALGQ